MPTLVLASTSPRRRELLALLGLSFEVDDPGYEEAAIPGEAPVSLARAFALGKAKAAAWRQPAAIVVGSDTLIDVDGDVLGKPVDAVEARAMLRRLQGRAHLIHSGVAVVQSPRQLEEVGVESVRVEMRLLRDDEIDAYVATGEWQAKAGAYSIQGAGGALIDRIVGDFPAVVGLPLRLTAELLGRAGLHSAIEIDALYRRKPYPNWAKFS